MVMPRDLRCNIRSYFICPNSTFNINKSHKISAVKALCFRRYQPKTSWGGGTPSAFRVNYYAQRDICTVTEGGSLTCSDHVKHISLSKRT